MFNLILLTMCDTPDSSCALLRLPDDLLWACLPEPDLEWAVCRRLFNMQLAGSGADRLGLYLKIQQAEDPEAKRETLARMVNTFPALSKLKIELHVGLQPEVLTTLLAPSPTEGPAWLSNIVDITISSGFSLLDDDINTYVDSFIPQCVARACPILQRLELQDMHIKQPSQWQPVSMPSLKELVLNGLHVSIEMQPEAVRQQLHALPSLQKFKIATYGNGEFVSSCSSKVTELRGNPWSGDSEVLYPLLHTLTIEGQVRQGEYMSISNFIPLSMFSFMPHLRHLVLPHISLTEVFKVDLSQLETITVGGCLNWALLEPVHNLLVNTVQPPKLYFRGGDRCLMIHVNQGSEAERDVKLASDFMAIMRRGGGLRRHDGSLVDAFFDLGTDNPSQVQRVMHGMFCAVSQPDEVWGAWGTHVDTALLMAIGAIDTCQHVKLAGKCTFEDGVWEIMVSLLPHVRKISLWLNPSISTADMKALCSHATHAVNVVVADLPHRRFSDKHIDELHCAAQGTLVHLATIRGWH